MKFYSLLAALLVVSCGQDPESDPLGKDTQLDPAKPLPETNAPKMDAAVQGEWKSSCRSRVTHVVSFKDGLFSKSNTLWGDDKCTIQRYEEVFTARYTVSTDDHTAKLGTDAVKINLRLHGLTNVFSTDADVVRANNNKYCERAEWTKHDVVEVWNTSCRNYDESFWYVLRFKDGKFTIYSGESNEAYTTNYIRK